MKVWQIKSFGIDALTCGDPRPGTVTGHFEAMNRAITAHLTRPVVDQVFAFRDSPEALKAMEKSRHFGKIVIQVVA